MAYGIDYLSYDQFCFVTTWIKMSFDGKETKQDWKVFQTHSLSNGRQILQFYDYVHDENTIYMTTVWRLPY